MFITFFLVMTFIVFMFLKAKSGSNSIMYPPTIDCHARGTLFDVESAVAGGKKIINQEEYFKYAKNDFEYT